MTIKYIKIGDYYYPNLKLKEEPKLHLSKYGRMKLRHLKAYEKILYTNLITTQSLHDYLQKMDQEANELRDKLTIDLKKQRGITETLKEKNQMLWVQEMNNIQLCIDEIIKKEVLGM